MKNRYNRLPRAGDIERESGTETIYLSPKPVPTGVRPFSARQLHRYADETFLDFSIGQGNFEFLARIGIGSITFIIALLFFFSGFASYLRRNAEPFLSGWSNFFFNPVIWLIIAAIATTYLYYFTQAARQVSIHPPIRFNRQRREVVFIPKKGDTPLYARWEDVIACVSAGTLITQYAATPEHKLMIGLRDANSGNVLWSFIPSGNLSLAISEWEAIRAYMEDGISALPTDESDELEEGTVEFFHLCRRSYRADYSFVRYVWGFLTIQFFSGWTLPCYISGWVNKRTKAGFPKEVQKWSQPLPTEQHAMPSEELLRESTEIREAFAKGQNLLDYFKVKFAETTQKSESAT
ncbi:DUF6708 domain-containing protein [Pseudomonas nunensis]|uniref:DUF6708 domain-containing protein n=1 Tax=Pseudomonas nunensis TaxID=2961896 RepID=A0ABY5EKN5_9PSED|nr:DUF6708 domain-containing protein [Pseudomonas nunensis]MCL5224886.1 hypothetical protein [Pseudomonas nunensis]UTO16214.1 hypothetical protein NK667_07665 [Pseudomonas nunensis]